MTLLNDETCKSTGNQLCAMGAKGNGFCVVRKHTLRKMKQSDQQGFKQNYYYFFQGDSGGGLYYNGTVIGIASYVKEGCVQGVPDTFIDVYKFSHWIHNKISHYN